METDGARLMTVKELGDFLQVSRITLWRWSRGNTGPQHIRLPGGTLRYRVSDVEAFIESHKRTPTP